MSYDICVIGSKALLFPFLQFGFTTFTPSSEKDLRGYITQAVENGYGIIYIEDAYCFQVRDILDKYWSSLTPIFIPIGENASGDSYSQNMVRALMKKAIGQDIL